MDTFAAALFLTTAADPSLALTRGCLTFPVMVTLFSNRHSEWTQERCLRKTGNGTVTQSEESITRMTFYGFPHQSNSPTLSLRMTS